MTPRFFVLFVLIFAAMVLGEWLQFFSGLDTHLWGFSNWLTLVFVLLAEGGAVWIITLAVDKALPAVGGRAPTGGAKQGRRGTQKYTAR